MRTGGEVVGYFQADAGVIGPAAWTKPEHGRAVLGLSLHAAGQQAGELKLMSAGINHLAIRAALDAKLRLVSSAHLLRSRAFGALDQYLPSGPVLF